MGKWRIRVPVGLRTIKTVIAVLIALMIVDRHGASPAKVVFATIGAMSAVGPTFKASWKECLSQICGVSIGALLAIVMTSLPIPSLLGVGVGIILIIVVYQQFPTKLGPVLPCLILVNVCLNPAVEVMSYSLGRIWDTAIGLGVGMAINMLVFPYDNSRSIRRMMESLDGELIEFLEDLFDGDEHYPDVAALSKKIDDLEAQLALFSEQKLLRRKRQKRELEQLKSCEEIAQDLLVEVETLRNMRKLGHLNQINQQALRSLGAKLPGKPVREEVTKEDVVVNYHVTKALALRQALKQELTRRKKQKP